MPKRILSVSNNTRLLVTHNDVLAFAGYDVVSPRIPAHALEMVCEGSYEAVVIGHSIPKDKRGPLIAAIRQRNPSIAIIFVYVAPDTGDEPAADFAVEVSDPVNLVRVLQQHRTRPAA